VCSALDWPPHRDGGAGCAADGGDPLCARRALLDLGVEMQWRIAAQAEGGPRARREDFCLDVLATHFPANGQCDYLDGGTVTVALWLKAPVAWLPENEASRWES
jgi:hypothetical protein